MKACVLMLMATTLAACVGGASVAVPDQFPVPIVSKLPLTLGVHLDEDLTQYVHSEAIEARGNWNIELGSAQKPMFENLLTGMFTGIQFVDDPKPSTSDIAGVLQPSIEELQFSIPSQTRTDYFEVWIRYKFNLYGRDGGLLGEWKLTAYGKAKEGDYGLQSTKPALQAAALAACRDAMAFFTLEFPKVPAVRRWLQTEIKEGAI